MEHGDAMAKPVDPKTKRQAPAPTGPKKSYSLQEVAFAYALCAERLVASDPDVLNTYYGTVPVLVHLLYQSLEISLKHIGRRFQLLGGHDSQDHRLYDSSHDVKALVDAIQAGFPGYDIVALLSATVTDDNLNANFLGRMLTGDEFADTRRAYLDRDLGYADLDSFTIFTSYIQEWIKAVKDTAQNLEKFIGVLKFIRAGLPPNPLPSDTPSTVAP